MLTGIYSIFNKKNGKVYIGSAIDIRNRIYKHLRELNLNIHSNLHLQNAWNKYRKNAFEIILLEETSKNKLLVLEQEYIDKYKESTYNIRVVARNNLGLKATKKTKKKMSIAQKNRWTLWRIDHPKLVKIKKQRTPWNKGKHLPEWIKIKLRIAKLKNPTRYWLGKSRSLETRSKISKKLTGRKLSKERIENIRKSHLSLTYTR